MGKLFKVKNKEPKQRIKDKPKKQEKEKIGKIKSKVPTKIAKYILWVLISFIVIRGVIACLRPDPTKKIYEDVNGKIEASQQDISKEDIVSAFAETFTKEYLTYTAGQTDEYRLRLEQFMTKESITTLIDNLTSDSKAINITAISIVRVDNDKFNVDVQAKVLYQAGEKDRFVRVPVIVREDKCIIDDVPLFIARPELAKIDEAGFEGDLAEADVTREVESMLKNFFKVYASGEDGEIKYYLTDDSAEISGLGGSFTFKSLSDLRVFIKAESNDEFIAMANYFIEDNDSKQAIKQRVRLDIKYKDNRYYINKMDTRGK